MSYRRRDSVGHTGRLYDGLQAVFGKEGVFKDMETIAGGEDFLTAVHEGLARADTAVVVIGPRWTEARSPDGRSRLFREDDTVRLEVREALASGKLVIPALVGGATFPGKDDIPEDLHPMLTLNALEISDSRWDTDMERLVAAITGEPAGRAVKRLLRGKRAPLDPLPFVAALILIGLLLVTLDDVSNSVGVSIAAVLCLFSLWRIRRRKSRGALFAWIALVACAAYAAALLAFASS